MRGLVQDRVDTPVEVDDADATVVRPEAGEGLSLQGTHVNPRERRPPDGLAGCWIETDEVELACEFGERVNRQLPTEHHRTARMPGQADDQATGHIGKEAIDFFDLRAGPGRGSLGPR